jgi:hypothetical protein
MMKSLCYIIKRSSPQINENQAATPVAIQHFTINKVISSKKYD